MKYKAKMWFLAMGVALVTLGAIRLPRHAPQRAGMRSEYGVPWGLTSASRKASARRSTDATSISTLRSSWWLITQSGIMSQFGTRLAGMGHSRAGPRNSRVQTTTLMPRTGKLSTLKDKGNWISGSTFIQTMECRCTALTCRPAKEFPTSTGILAVSKEES